MFKIVVLVLISIFVPPFWFVTLGYIVYLWLTKKKRRNKVILSEIIESIALKRDQVELGHIYFEAAKSFAVEHGAELSKYENDPSDDTLIVELNIGGEDYQVTLQRWNRDETLMSVCTTTKANENLKSILGADHILFKSQKEDNTKQPLDELRLVSVVNKVEDSEYGAFVNINNDLGYFIEENEDCDALIKMAYAYARRFSVAAMYMQGVVKKELYDHVLMVFKGLQLSTGQTVQFQEDAAEQAIELIESYTSLFDEESLKFIVYAVENGLDSSGIGEGIHDIHKIAFAANQLKQQFASN